MFIVERLVGVGTFAIILILACALIARKGSKYKRILFIYTIALAMMGFFYVPYKTADLYRIYEYLENFQTMDLSYFMERYSSSSTFIAYLYYFLFAKIGEFRLLPSINAFICYSCIFYILNKTAEKYNIERKNIALTLFFYMSIGTYIATINGIRTILAISLICFCFFRETVENKFKWYHIILYFLAAFIHNFAVVIILIRLLIPIFDKSIKFERKLVYIMFLFVLTIFMVVNMSELFDSVFERAEEYITGDAYSYTWGYLIGLLVVFSIIYILLKYRKTSYNKIENFSQIKSMSILLIFTGLIFCFEYSIFYRTLTNVLPIIIIPCLMVTLQQRQKTLFFKIVLMFSISIMIISFIRGNMCSYKFFIL